ncbi:uncharacterized protein LOC115437381 [Sphaeramia orbicularis]|uniref:uncharacterized protein LOC115437381 n=1 Tax=Sphaeramia orbicularis TaxID=375764 RepID=UPI0011805638|nr:uncharacterized protein LOC115437381 [Sphaeramia orbicularis]
MKYWRRKSLLGGLTNGVNTYSSQSQSAVSNQNQTSPVVSLPNTVRKVLTDSNQSQSAVSDQNQTSPVVSPPNMVRKGLDEEMHSTVCGASNSPSTVKNINEVPTDSNQNQSAVSDQNQTSPVVSPPNTVRKVATDHYNQLSCPGQMDPAVSTKYPLWTSVLSVWDLYLPTSGLAMYAKMRLCSVTLKPVQGNLMTAARQSQQQNVELWSLWILTLQSKSKFMTWKILDKMLVKTSIEECQRKCLKAEVATVLRHFRDHIQKGKLATKNECSQWKLWVI